MTIYIESNETGGNSRMPKVSSAVVCPILEAITGADIMISPISLPVTTDFLIKKHIEAGAILVQRKSGHDLLASVTYRLYKSIATMRETGAKYWQCVLLTTGFYAPNTNDGSVDVIIMNDGKTIIDPSPLRVNYMALQSALRRWVWMGGVHASLSCDAEIPAWLMQTENKLKEVIEAGRPAKEIMPDGQLLYYDPRTENNPLQQPKLIKDWRAKFIMLVDGVGPALVTTLQDYMIENGMENSLMEAVSFAMSDEVCKLPGWGKKKSEAVKMAMGLAD